MHNIENDHDGSSSSANSGAESVPNRPHSDPNLADLFNELFPELHLAAEGAMVGQEASHTLQATALVNECYMRLMKAGKDQWADRRHFLNSASQVMRSVLIDHYRAKSAGKRPRNRVDFELDYIVTEIEEQGVNLEKLESALNRLEEQKPEMALMVQLKFFCGLEMKEIADTLKMQPRTLERHWKTTRAWLFMQMRKS